MMQEKVVRKKFQVFISSTSDDLKEERKIAIEAILDAGHIPAGMEIFKGGGEKWETIQKWIDDSDIYVLILGGRYGSTDKQTNLSYFFRFRDSQEFSINIIPGSREIRLFGDISVTIKLKKVYGAK